MQDRSNFLAELTDVMHSMLETIEERETVEPDFALVREIAEQLKEEIESLKDE